MNLNVPILLFNGKIILYVMPQDHIKAKVIKRKISLTVYTVQMAEHFIYSILVQSESLPDFNTKAF